MNCQEFWKSLPEFPPKGEQWAHLRDCPACARQWEQQRNLTAGLRAMAAESRRVEAPHRLEARLTAAFREHAGVGRTRPGKSSRTAAWLPAANWLAAAAA